MKTAANKDSGAADAPDDRVMKLAAGTKNFGAYLRTLDPTGEATGTVAVGARADLVLLSGNPLEDVGHAQRPAGVMIGGRWLDRTALDRRLAVVEREECAWRLVEGDTERRRQHSHHAAAPQGMPLRLAPGARCCMPSSITDRTLTYAP